MVVVEDRSSEAEPQLHPDNVLDAAFYMKSKATLKVIFALGWVIFIQQCQFNELDDRMSNLKKTQKQDKSPEETAVELYGEMYMDTKLIRKFITQQIAAAMAEKTKQYENKIKNWRKVERMECQESCQKKE